MSGALHERMWHVLTALAVAAFAAGCEKAINPASPSASDAGPLVDKGPSASAASSIGRAAEVDLTWYEGEEYLLRFPSAGSANDNQFMFGCFDLGPDQTGKVHDEVGTIYALLLPGTSHDSCPDGTVQHDHLVSAIPGVQGYTPFWEVIFVQPGPAFGPGIVPLTSESAVMAAESAGQVTFTPAGFVVHAAVVGRAN